ncbi:MAG: AraC family transcriptional regulator [Spirochaetales bacterium]|nr:AraC family transcriptional regulator [Spirochaetales bacterium]
MEYNTHFFKSSNPFSYNILYSGRQACPPGHRFGGIRSHFLFHLIHKGCGSVRAMNRKVNLNSGDGFLFFPHQMHYYRASDDDPWDYSWVSFEGPGLVQNLKSFGFSPSEVEYRSLNNTTITGCMNKLRIMGSEKTEGIIPLRAGSYLLEILAELADSRRQKPARLLRKIDYIDEVKLFLDKNYTSPLGVYEIADHIGVNASYLSTVFKKGTGHSLQKFLIDFRMKKACELLEQTEYKVADIASSVGYKDYYTFAKCFKRTYHTSPSEFRKLNRRIL